MYFLDAVLPRDADFLSTEKWSTVKGKVAIVTNADSSIGFATAESLVLRGATVVLGCRDPSACHQTAARLAVAAVSGNGNAVVGAPLDLEDFGTVAQFVDGLVSVGRPVDFLLNIPVGASKADVDGVHPTFRAHYLGPFYLAEHLLGRPGRTKLRVVNVAGHFSALCHHVECFQGVLQGNSFPLEDDVHYARAKAAAMLHAWDIPRRYGDATAVSLELGLVESDVQWAAAEALAMLKKLAKVEVDGNVVAQVVSALRLARSSSGAAAGILSAMTRTSLGPGVVMNAVGRPEEPLAPTSALDAVVAGGLELARLGAAQGLPVPFA